MLKFLPSVILLAVLVACSNSPLSFQTVGSQSGASLNNPGTNLSSQNPVASPTPAALQGQGNGIILNSQGLLQLNGVTSGTYLTAPGSTEASAGSTLTLSSSGSYAPFGGEISNSTTGLQLLLHLDEAAGAATFQDSSPLAASFTCEGTCPTAGGSGQFFNAATFDGATMGLTGGTTASITGGYVPYSISAWVKIPAGTSNGGVVIEQRANGGGNPGIDGSYILFTGAFSENYFTKNLPNNATPPGGGSVGFVTKGVSQNNPGLIVYTASSLVNDGNWHHIVVVRSTAPCTGTIYIDGVSSATASCTNNDDLSGKNPIYLGYDSAQTNTPSSSSFNFTGMIDELAVYQGATAGALTAAQVAALYQRGAVQLNISAGTCPTNTALCTPTTLVPLTATPAAPTTFAIPPSLTGGYLVFQVSMSAPSAALSPTVPLPTISP